MKRVLPLLLLLVASIGVSQTTGGRSSGLHSTQLKKLRATKLRFLVPTRVPAGYKVVRLNLEPDKDPMMVHLSIVYKKGASQIILQMSSEGLGDLFFDEDPDKGKPKGVLKWSSPILKDRGPIEYQTEKGQMHWHINWVEFPGRTYPRYISAIGYGSDPKLGKQVLESLRWLK